MKMPTDHVPLLFAVIPAKAGIHRDLAQSQPKQKMDSRLRGNDDLFATTPLFAMTALFAATTLRASTERA